MIKWFAYIVLIIIFAPRLLFAGVKNNSPATVYNHEFILPPHGYMLADTVQKTAKQKEQDDKHKVKEVAKAKKQAKPTKVDDNGEPEIPKPKPKRQRRPEGLERPPEIPRRNGN